MSIIDQILLLLKDGEWHNLKDITKIVALPKEKAELVAKFLSQYDFIQTNENLEKLKLKPTLVEFFKKIQHIEKEEMIKNISSSLKQ